MHVVLVGAELEENLALRYLAAALERGGHTVQVASFDGPEDGSKVLATVSRERPALLGLSMTFQRRAVQFGQLAADLRQAGFAGHITCGGHFPTFAYAEVLERFTAIDSVVRHEGEDAICELCDALERGAGIEELGTIAGLAYRLHDGSVTAAPARPLCADLDALPMPKRFGEPQIHLGIPAAFIVGSRGCYGHCTFCCINAFIRDAGGPKYRERSAANIADEMASLRRERGARMFVFHDDDFFTRDHARDLARVTALRDALRERGVDDIALVVKARPDDLDEQVFDVLEDIGLLRVYLGIEAGSTQGLKTLGRGVDLELNRKGLDFLRRRDVYACFNMLIFDPDTTLDSLRSSLDLLAAYPEVPMNFCRTEIYVGTPLMRRLEREGRLIGDTFGWDYEIGDSQAERVFRVFARAFLDRNFRCDGLMNSNLGLGYHLHLMRRFYPEAITPALRAQATDVIRRVNLDCVERMTQFVDFVASHDESEDEAFSVRMYHETNSAGVDLERQVAEATTAILRAVDACRAPERRPANLWRSVAAATLALSPLACDPLMPPDPLPPPEQSSSPDYPPPPDPPPPPTIASELDAGPAPSASATASATATASALEIHPPMDPPPPPTVKPLPPPDPPPPPTRPLPLPPDPLPPPYKGSK